MADQTTPPGAYPYGPPPQQAQAAPPPVVQAQPVAAAARRPSTAWKVIKVLFVIFLVVGLGVSVLVNLVLMGVVAAAGAEGSTIQENTLVDLGESGARDRFAVIDINGVMDGNSAVGWAEMVDKARRDDRVKAVVLVINSPGGAMNSADALYMSLKKLRDSGKPIVVSMGSVAASGGYYAAMAADEIVAEPTTITGSIGVMMPHINISEFLGKHGITDETFVATGSDKKYTVSWTKKTEPAGRKMIQTILDDAYERFLEIVKTGRSMSDEKARTLADGSIYTATQAKDSGLIDHIGYLEDAVDRAEAISGVTTYRVVRYVRPFSWRNLFMMQAQGRALTVDPGRILAPRQSDVLYLWPGMNPSLTGIPVKAE